MAIFNQNVSMKMMKITAIAIFFNLAMPAGSHEENNTLLGTRFQSTLIPDHPVLIRAIFPVDVSSPLTAHILVRRICKQKITTKRERGRVIELERYRESHLIILFLDFTLGYIKNKPWHAFMSVIQNLQKWPAEPNVPRLLKYTL